MRNRWTICVLVFAVVCGGALGQHSHGTSETKPAVLLEGMGSLHHPISTNSEEAQKFFDQGLTLIYGFNHEEAVRSFQRAGQLDQHACMPAWGVALALGPNYNLDVDPEREKAAYEAVRKAQVLADSCTRSERDYIDALAKRCSQEDKLDLKKLAKDYAEAMSELAKSYPDDPDAATIYAESLMDLNPWGLWKLDGTPAEGTLTIVSVLEGVLARYPDHIGANHYYVHAVEASPHAAWALPSAKRLTLLVPNGGHLVHMPSHIYARVGDFEAAVKSNDAAAAVDRTYIQASGAKGGVYPAMYYSHNLHFLADAAMEEGNFAKALNAARVLEENIRMQASEMPEDMTAPFSAYHMEVLLRFNRWEEILALPQPKSAAVVVTKMWHYARGVAFAARGKVDEAAKEQKELKAGLESIPDKVVAGFTAAKTILQLADTALSARIADTRRDGKASVEMWRQAAAMEDQLAYDEPPDWYYHVRESLGGTLLKDGKAEEAEAVFREDLQRNPRSARSLFGLWPSLEAQKKNTEAEWAKRQFEEAWKNADTKLRVEDL